MNITTYIKKYWDDLPKSSFDGEEVVIFKEISAYDWGYGHHDYQGIGVNKDGNVVWAYSSGCSCQGTASTTHKDERTVKLLLAEWKTEGINPKNIDFPSLCVSYDSYG